MGDIVQISNIGYKFVIKPTLYERKTRSGVVTKQLCLIGVQHENRNRFMAHSFSEFVLKLRMRSYSAMKNRAESVVRFLNYVLVNNHKYKLKSFADLNATHGMDYLNSLADNERSESYINNEDNNLTKFYYYLAKKELLNGISEGDFKFIIYKKTNKKTDMLESFFPERIHMSNKKLKKPLHNLEADLLVLFLELAKRVTPRIALGIYFQVMGGMRASECCNCTQTGITTFGRYGEFGMNIVLETQHFRPKAERTETSVKKPRIQSIELFRDYLPGLYATHLKWYLSTDGSLALFSDANGNAMTLQTYSRYFAKLKEAFIKTLEEADSEVLNAYAVTLRSFKWKTHIGRGIFSNIMAEITQNAILLKGKRGDADIESQDTYIENTPTRKRQSAEAMDGMYESGERVLDAIVKKEVSVNEHKPRERA